jgi:hypothetical protein
MGSTTAQRPRAKASRFVRMLRWSPTLEGAPGGLARTVESSPFPAVPSTFAPPAPPAGIVDVLASWSGTDFVRQPQLDALERAFEAAGDRGAAAAKIVEFFTAHPETGRILYPSQFYARANRSSASFQLALLASAYADGRTDGLAEAAERLIALADHEVTRAIAVRAIGIACGVEAECTALDEAMERFPESYLLGLYQAEFLIANDEVAAANAVVERHRPRIAAELADEIAVAEENQQDLDGAIAEERLELSDGKDIYDDAFCRSMWISYYESYNTRNERQHGDRLLANIYLRQLADLGGDVDLVVDFGSMCAQPLYEAALRMPGVQFFACDRQPLIAELNEAAYPAANLHFLAMDIFDMLAEASKLPGRKALTHVRTTTVLYPHLVQKLYAACRDFGIDHILLIENAGMLRTKLRFLDFHDMPAPAVVTKHKLYLHDYQSMLAAAGYSVREWERLRGPGLWRGFHPSSYLGSQYALHAARA